MARLGGRAFLLAYAYERLMMDAVRGNLTLFVRRDGLTWYEES